MFRGSLCFRVYFFSSCIFRASFSKDNKYPVSNNTNINYIRLVSMCSLGTVLWLTLVLAGHLCSLNGVTVEMPPATFLHSPVLQINRNYKSCYIEYRIVTKRNQFFITSNE